MRGRNKRKSKKITLRGRKVGVIKELKEVNGENEENEEKANEERVEEWREKCRREANCMERE